MYSAIAEGEADRVPVPRRGGEPYLAFAAMLMARLDGIEGPRPGRARRLGISSKRTAACSNGAPRLARGANSPRGDRGLRRQGGVFSADLIPHLDRLQAGERGRRRAAPPRRRVLPLLRRVILTRVEIHDLPAERPTRSRVDCDGRGSRAQRDVRDDGPALGDVGRVAAPARRRRRGGRVVGFGRRSATSSAQVFRARGDRHVARDRRQGLGRGACVCLDARSRRPTKPASGRCRPGLPARNGASIAFFYERWALAGRESPRADRKALSACWRGVGCPLGTTTRRVTYDEGGGGRHPLCASETVI